jgi:hypothetical protein
MMYVPDNYDQFLNHEMELEEQEEEDEQLIPAYRDL